MNTIFSLICISISLLQIFLLVYTRQRLRAVFVQPVLFDLVIFLYCYGILVGGFLISVLRLFSNWQYEIEINILPLEVTYVYILEFISFCAWLFAFIWVSQGRIFKHEKISTETLLIKSKWSRDNGNMVFAGKKISSRQNIQSSAIAFLTIVCIIYLIRSIAEIIGYKADVILGGFDWFFSWAIILAGPVIAFYLFAIGKTKAGLVSYVVGTIASFLALVVGMASGSRGPIIGPVIWLTFLILFVRKSRLTIIVAVSGLLVVGLFHSEMIKMRGFFYSSENIEITREMNVIDNINMIVNIPIETKTLRQQLSDFLNATEWRFGETSRLSVAFLRQVDEGKYAGLKPISSALFVFFPRKFFPDKPEPGSVDGSKATMGMYMIEDVIRNTPWTMSGFLSGLHAYWEMGWFGLIFFSALAAIYVAVLTHLLGKLGLAGLPMLLIMLVPWELNPKPCIYKIILEIFHTLLPLMLIWYFIKFISKLRKIRVKKQII